MLRKMYDNGDGTNGGGNEGPEMEFFEEGDGGAGAGAGAGGDAGKVKPTYDFVKFSKEVFGDDEPDADEDKVITKAKGLKAENENLRIIAEGREALDKDQEIINYRSLLKSNDDSLAYMFHVNRLMKGGHDQQTAEVKAKSVIEKLKAKGEDGQGEIEEIALEARANIRDRINTKEATVLDKIKSAKGTIDLRSNDGKEVEKSKNAVAKLEKFLGFKLPTDHKDKIVKEAQDYIGSDQEKKDLQNPEIRAKFAMFVKHEKQWEKNVESRKNGKVKAIESAVANPKIAQSRGFKPTQNAAGKGKQGSGRVMKNPSSFLGS